MGGTSTSTTSAAQQRAATSPNPTTKPRIPQPGKPQAHSLLSARTLACLLALNSPRQRLRRSLYLLAAPACQTPDSGVHAHSLFPPRAPSHSRLPRRQSSPDSSAAFSTASPGL